MRDAERPAGLCDDAPASPSADEVDAQSRVRAGAPGSHPEFDALVRTIWRLRQPDGCPWDRRQTHASIAGNMIEEAYEAVDAIEATAAPAPAGAPAPGEPPAPAGEARAERHLAEELGDVLMQVVLHAQIASDEHAFTIDDVCRGINEKLVRRHPHVFAEGVDAETPADVAAIWSRVKLAERRGDAATVAPAPAPSASSDAAPASATPSASPVPSAAPAAPPAEARDAGCPQPPGLLDGVPTALPALMACQKISRKAAAAGFEWASLDAVWEQVRSEVAEYNDEEPGSPAAAVEFGDVLFALVNVARWQGVDAEGALRASNAKFRRRWSYVERCAWERGADVSDLSTDELNALWREAKDVERGRRAPGA